MFVRAQNALDRMNLLTYSSILRLQELFQEVGEEELELPVQRKSQLSH